MSARKILKLAWRTLLILTIVFLVVIFSSYALLQLPKVQTYLTSLVVDYLEEELQTEAYVGGVDVGFFNRVILEDVYLEDLEQDTLLRLHKLHVGILGFSAEEHYLKVGKVELEDLNFYLRKYNSDGELNLKFLIEYFKQEKPDSAASYGFTFDELAITNAAFIYEDQTVERRDIGIDYKGLVVNDIQLAIEDIAIVEDSIYGNITHLSCIESKGFRLKDFRGLAKVAPDVLKVDDVKIVTAKTDVDLDLLFTYNEWSDYLTFIDDVRMDIKVADGSHMDFGDLSYFAPQLMGMRGELDVSGHVKGTVKSMKGRGMILGFADRTYLEGDVDLDGLPNLDETFIFLDLKELVTDYYDLQRIPVPPFSAVNYLKVPDNLVELGAMKFNGNFTGFFSDFVAFGSLDTRIGSIRTDLLLRQDESLGTLSYKGKLKTNRLDIGRLMRLDSIGTVSLDFAVDGHGTKPEEIDAHLEGAVRQVEILGYDYTNIDMNGRIVNMRFDGDFSISDENLDMGFAGAIDLSDKIPEFNFQSTVQHANLEKLNLWKQKPDASIKGDVIFKFKGNDIDNVLGSIQMFNLRYSDTLKTFQVGNVDFSVNESEGAKHLRLESSIADARFDGQFNFKNLPRAFNNLIRKHLPKYAKDFETLAPEDGLNFAFNVALEKPDLITHLFLPEFTFGPNTGISGRYSTEGDVFQCDGRISEMNVSGIGFNNIMFAVDNPTEQFEFDVECSAIQLSDSVFVRNIDLITKSFDNHINFDLEFDNRSRKGTKGDLNGTCDFVSAEEINISIDSSDVTLANMRWLIDPAGRVRVLDKKVQLEKLKVSNRNEVLFVDGIIGKLPDDELVVSLQEFDISKLNLLLERTGLEVQGFISGDARMKGLVGEMNLVSDLQVEGLELNGSLIGTGSIKSTWHNAKKAIRVDALLEHDDINGLKVNGWFYPLKKKDNYDLTASFDGMPLSAFEHYIEETVSDIKGVGSAKLTVTGNTASPDLNGVVTLTDASVLVNFLNTRYNVSSAVKVASDGFFITNATFSDRYGKTGFVDGYLKHKNFRNWDFDVTINANNVFALNTTSALNQLFYGRAFASGIVKFTGKPGDILMDIAMKTERGSRFAIPLYGAETVVESDFVTFVSNGQEPEEPVVADKYKIDLSSLTMDFDLEVTPDAEVQLIFDPKTGDIMKGKGSGDINMQLSKLGGFKMFGDFVVQEGEYLFTLQNIINKKFLIHQGGTISWSGNPYDATLDVTGSYSVRTSLYDLMYPDTTNDSYRRRMLVDCRLHMKEKLLNPTISFGIDLPNASDQINTEVQNKIGIGNEQELNRQVFGLLVLNKFFPTAGSGLGQETGGFLSASSAEMLSNQLSNWLSKISNDFDVGVNYRPGNEITNDEVELALSTQIFNNRLIIDGNVGVANRQTNTSDIVGDVNVEYKITSDGRLRVKAFNKSNDISSLEENNAPFTQGVGISYQQDFNTLGDLFKFLKPKKDKAREPEEEVKID